MKNRENKKNRKGLWTKVALSLAMTACLVTGGVLVAQNSSPEGDLNNWQQQVSGQINSALAATPNVGSGLNTTIKKTIMMKGTYAEKEALWTQAVADSTASESVLIVLEEDWLAETTSGKYRFGDATPSVEGPFNDGHDSIYGFLHVPENKNITIDLNGHKIDRQIPQSSPIGENGMVIIVTGTLTILDTSGLKDADGNDLGRITGGSCKDIGGGLYVNDGATVNLYSGSICNNYAMQYPSAAAKTIYSGVGVMCMGTFNMYGGYIFGNEILGGSKADRGGGGIGLNDNGQLNMYGGEIHDNKANYGSGVALFCRQTTSEIKVFPKFNLYGGKIYKNTSTATTKSVNASNPEDDGYFGAVTINQNVFPISEAAVNPQAIFTMYGGEISENEAVATTYGYATAAGVVNYSGIFKMYGGKISKNYVTGAKLSNDGASAVFLGQYKSQFKMYGGEISGNYGGACGTILVHGKWTTTSMASANRPTFSMYGGIIKENKSMVGGSAILNLGNLNLYGGIITGNICNTVNDTQSLSTYGAVALAARGDQAVVNVGGGIVIDGNKGEKISAINNSGGDACNLWTWYSTTSMQAWLNVKMSPYGDNGASVDSDYQKGGVTHIGITRDTTYGFTDLYNANSGGFYGTENFFSDD
ncbi:MAG: hypothetical protein K2N84_01145, partial [Clostridia bacterium]|nr:hypothetical protein [Clostridia bacterium]